MSYILDALKKSQQERQQQQGPTLQTLQSHPPPMSRQTNPWPWLFALTLVLVLAAAGYLYWQQSLGMVPAAEPVVSSKAADQTDSTRAVSEPRLADEPATVAVSEAATVTPPPLQEMYQLPDPVQQQMPALTFSFHVYSTTPERRTIIINGQRLREGASISGDLTLEEITEQGVILNWKNRHRVFISVVENW